MAHHRVWGDDPPQRPTAARQLLAHTGGGVPHPCY